MNVTIHSFFKDNEGYIYIKDNNIFNITVEMFECFKRQYLVTGWRMFEYDFAITFSYTQSNIDKFLERLHN